MEKTEKIQETVGENNGKNNVSEANKEVSLTYHEIYRCKMKGLKYRF